MCSSSIFQFRGQFTHLPPIAESELSKLSPQARPHCPRNRLAAQARRHPVRPIDGETPVFLRALRVLYVSVRDFFVPLLGCGYVGIRDDVHISTARPCGPCGQQGCCPQVHRAARCVDAWRALAPADRSCLGPQSPSRSKGRRSPFLCSTRTVARCR
jgi:hypothetical protein